MGPSWYTFEGSEATSQSRKSGSQSFVTFASSMNMNLHEFSGICPLYVLRNQKADHVTKFQLQSSVAQRVGTCIVHFCLNSKPRAVHTIEACINQYGSFLKWVYPKSSWVSMRKWFNDWMFWGHPYFRKPPNIKIILLIHIIIYVYILLLATSLVYPQYIPIYR